MVRDRTENRGGMYYTAFNEQCVSTVVFRLAPSTENGKKHYNVHNIVSLQNFSYHRIPPYNTIVFSKTFDTHLIVLRQYVINVIGYIIIYIYYWMLHWTSHG